MAEPYLFPGERVLFDVTVTKVVPGATHTTVITGQSSNDPTGSSKITTIGSASSILSTALSGLYGDLTRLAIVSPIDSAGDPVDCAIWPYVDGSDLGDHLMFDASQGGNMMPLKGKAVGFTQRVLGIPFRKALNAAIARQAKGHVVTDFATKATGIKATRQYQFKVFSAAGFGNAAAATTPLRIIGIGDKLDGQALAAVGELIDKNGYPGLISRSVAPYGSLSVVHTLKGGLKPATWSATPGGIAQQGPRVFRFFRYAYNNVATGATGLFVLSNQNAVQGAQGNVMDDNHDLGFDYATSADWLEFLEYGIRPGANAFSAGFKVDDTVLPDNPNGFAATTNVNPYPFGNASPMRAASDEYYPMSPAAWPIVAFKNKVAFFIQANGTAEAANATSVAVGGLQIQQGHQG